MGLLRSETMQIEIHTNGSSYTIHEPLCGSDWLREHIRDHTHAEIESLSIVVSQDGKDFATVRASNGKGTIKDLVRLRR